MKGANIKFKGCLPVTEKKKTNILSALQSLQTTIKIILTDRNDQNKELVFSFSTRKNLKNNI